MEFMSAFVYTFAFGILLLLHPTFYWVLRLNLDQSLCLYWCLTKSLVLYSKLYTVWHLLCVGICVWQSTDVIYLFVFIIILTLPHGFVPSFVLGFHCYGVCIWYYTALVSGCASCILLVLCWALYLIYHCLCVWCWVGNCTCQDNICTLWLMLKKRYWCSNIKMNALTWSIKFSILGISRAKQKASYCNLLGLLLHSYSLLIIMDWIRWSFEPPEYAVTYFGEGIRRKKMGKRNSSSGGNIICKN